MGPLNKFAPFTEKEETKRYARKSVNKKLCKICVDKLFSE